MPKTRLPVQVYQLTLVLWLLSNAVIMFSDVSWLVLPAAGLLFGFLPGFLAVRLLFAPFSESLKAEQYVLGAATSYGLASLAVLVVHFLPGPLTLGRVLAGIDLLMAILWVLTFLRDTRKSPGEPMGVQRAGKSWKDVVAALLPFVFLLVLVFVFRFVSLDYSEYQGDEIDVTSLARLAIAGQDDAFFLHRKGPVELVIASAFALFSRNFNEFALRFPFALASGWAVIGTYVLGRRLWGPSLGVLAGALLAVNGIFLGFSRMVQYQGVVVLMLVSAVMCFYLLHQGKNALMETRLGVLGLGLWGIGLLSHYEASLIGLVLAYIYLHKHPLPRWRWRTARPLAIAAVVIALGLLAYYIPFVTHDHFTDTFRRYTEIRISPERLPFNNLGDYLISSLFYNSVYYEVVMTVGLLAAAWFGLRRAFEVRAHPVERSIPWPAAVLWIGLLVGLVGGAVIPSMLQVGNIQIALLLVVPAFVVLSFGRRVDIRQRILFLWFALYLAAYAFLIRIPGLHYYTLMPAWALLAARGLGEAASRPISRSSAWRTGLAAVTVVLSILLLYHPYILFVRTTPEYALSYPEYRSPLYWNTSSERPERFFGLPHRSGWKAAGYLFKQGTLRGDYRSNEKEEIVTWYTGQSLSDSERPTYYVIADNATEKPHKQDYPAEVLASDYQEICRVTVANEPRLHIYRLKPTDDEIGVFQDEALSAVYDQQTALRPPEEVQP